MPLQHLLDTSIFSQPIKDHPVPGVLDRWTTVGDDGLCTAAICLAEVLQGLTERDSAKYWRRYRELLENRYPVLPFDAGTAAVYARLAAELRQAGRPRPTMDLLIASIARQHELVLVTLNSSDFAKIPGLAVEDWSTD